MVTNVHRIKDERHMIISMAIVETIDKIQHSIMIKTLHTLLKEKMPQPKKNMPRKHMDNVKS